MIGIIKRIFGIGVDISYKDLLNNGAIIVDVRSANEFASGHINGSINISLETLTNNLSKFKNKDQIIITCCASGMRSSIAKSNLSSKGYKNVYNGGSWKNINAKINNT